MPPRPVQTTNCSEFTEPDLKESVYDAIWYHEGITTPLWICTYDRRLHLPARRTMWKINHHEHCYFQLWDPGSTQRYLDYTQTAKRLLSCAALWHSAPRTGVGNHSGSNAEHHSCPCTWPLPVRPGTVGSAVMFANAHGGDDRTSKAYAHNTCKTAAFGPREMKAEVCGAE